MDLTSHWVGIASLVVFVLAYFAVIVEERTFMRKSKPVMLAAAVIWALIGYQYADSGLTDEVEKAVDIFLIDFSQMFLFLLAAMTYVNSMSERNVFAALRTWLMSKGFGLRTVFWITGVMSFFLSPVIDNLTTALVMCAVVLSVGQGHPRFITAACINIVVAANAGGAFSPFGDITTLMVWQRGVVPFQSFFVLFVPAVVNYLVPAALISLTVPKGSIKVTSDKEGLKRGARRIVLLFILTIVTAVSFHSLFGLPAFMGMMAGLAYLKFFGYYLRRTHLRCQNSNTQNGDIGDVAPFDSFRAVAQVEWDTLLFFFGVIMSVGGLGFIGYLEHLSGYLYGELGPTTANILIGVLSSVIDNIPIMVAVLEMNPAMGMPQWLLVTLTAGVGGSLLSIGSAAGVALMGQARNYYTFFGHLRWTPAIALGYGLSIWVHLLLNG